MKILRWFLLLASFALPGFALAQAQTEKHGSIVLEHVTSEILRENRTGLNPVRSVTVYLPPDYHDSGKSYPVIYYFHSFFWDNERMFADGNVQKILDRAISDHVIRNFILVAANYSTPTTGSFYENSATSGRWIDFTVKELLPFIESRFRIIPRRDSRGLAGEFIGGYGALKLAMLYPDLFGSVYALHPVGTGTGLTPMTTRADWAKVHRAKSFSDLAGDGYSQVFVAMSQAYLPNPDRPPFYCDFIVEMENGVPKPNVANIKKLKARFMLDALAEEHADNLRKLRGIKFDWGRYDSNQDHVYGNQAFTRKLEDLAIEHEAEEYRGSVWDKNWIDHGRVYGDVMPFFNRYLDFGEK